MRIIEIIAIIVYFALLILALIYLIGFYICDGQNCNSFKEAEKKATKDSLEYVISLNSSLFADGIWCLPYVAASISTPISLWFMNAKFSVLNYAISFLVSFAVFYFTLSFFGHHYLKVIGNYTVDWLRHYQINENENSQIMILENESSSHE